MSEEAKQVFVELTHSGPLRPWYQWELGTEKLDLVRQPGGINARMAREQARQHGSVNLWRNSHWKASNDG